MPKTVLVTGASGFIAQQLILDLLEQGHSVRGTVRSLAKGDALKTALGAHSPRASEIELVEADLESDRGWAEAVAGEGSGIGLTSINPVAVFGPIRSAQVKTSVGIIAQLLAGKFPALPDAGIQVVDVRDVSAAHIAAMDDPATIGERYIVADDFFWMKDVAEVLLAACPDRASKLPRFGMPDFVVRFLALFSGDMKTIAAELGKRRFASSEKVRKLLGRDLIRGDEAIRASAETLIRHGAR